MPRWFNTAGPNDPSVHYTLPVLERLPELNRLVETRSWFVLHAPRQSGKTTVMRAFAQELTASGRYAALVASCEAGEPYATDPAKASEAIVADIRRKAGVWLPEALRPPVEYVSSGTTPLADHLTAWSMQCPLPVVLLLDEIDALQDESLVSVLRQLRTVYAERPRAAPSTVALVGLRDVRDYRMATVSPTRLGTASPFNVSVKSLVLRSFTETEVASLYGQHTVETGQEFSDAALALAWRHTRGQPWLVNALANQMLQEMGVTGPVEGGHVDVAKEQLVIARATHIDSLAHRLTEPRVRAVIEPILTGVPRADPLASADVEYCLDLGIVERGESGGLFIANPIYREVLPRELTQPTLDSFPASTTVQKGRWTAPDGRLDIEGLLVAFVDFWRQHGEWMVRGQAWSEAAHQIVLMAFLQRVVNGGGAIEREYGLGTRRLDILVRWFPRRDALGVPLEEDRHAIEVKVWRTGQRDPLVEGLSQLDAYCERLGLRAGTLVIFDARTGDQAVAWSDRGALSTESTQGGRATRVLRA